MIRGLQFGIGGYERGDFEQLSIQRPETAGIVDPQVTLNDEKLDFLGVHQGDCVQHNIDEGDYIKTITVKHSENAINVLQFETEKGIVRSIGSDQDDDHNEFGWEVTVVELSEHERLQGAYSHVQRIRGEIRLSTIGFFTSNCWYEEIKPIAKPAVTPPTEAEDT